MLQAVIFDMDGTLFQTNMILELALEDTFTHLASLGEWEGTTPIEKYREIMGVPLPEVWKTLLPNHSPEWRVKMNDFFQERLIDNIEMGKGALYPNVENLFQSLKDNNYAIYIASNGLTHYLQAIVAYYRLNRWVDETFSIERIETLHKTDLVKSILEKYNITKAAVVGDRLSDINAAKDNGLIAIGCHFDFANEKELAQADFVVHDLDEVVGIVRSIGVNEVIM